MSELKGAETRSKRDACTAKLVHKLAEKEADYKSALRAASHWHDKYCELQEIIDGLQTKLACMEAKIQTNSRRQSSIGTHQGSKRLMQGGEVMELEELLFRKHMKDAQRGRELLTDKEFVELEKQMAKTKLEIKTGPLPDFGMADFVNEIVTPRTTKMKTMAEAWERRLLEEAYRLCAWRISYVSWYEWGNGICHCCTRIWPVWQTKQALKFAKEKGEHVVTLNFKKWLLYTDSEFNHYSGTSPNKDIMIKMRRVLGARCRRKCK